MHHRQQAVVIAHYSLSCVFNVTLKLWPTRGNVVFVAMSSCPVLPVFSRRLATMSCVSFCASLILSCPVLSCVCPAVSRLPAFIVLSCPVLCVCSVD